MATFTSIISGRNGLRLLLLAILAVSSLFLLHVFHFSLLDQPHKQKPQLMAKDEVYMNRLRNRASQLLDNLKEDKARIVTIVEQKRKEEMQKPGSMSSSSSASSTSSQGSGRDFKTYAKSATSSISSSSSSESSSSSTSSSSVRNSWANHPILTLSDSALLSTPFNELMAPYGQSDGGGSCSSDFGNDLIDRWRQTKKNYCTAPTGKAVTSSTLGTNIDCYLVHQTRHHGHGDNLCVMNNVAVNLGLFGEDEKITRPVVKEYVDTGHMKQPYIKFPMGFVSADCTTDPSLWNSMNFPGWNADWTVTALQTVEPSNSKSQCDEWVEHPVLVVQRDTFANFFHDSEDFFNVFVALSILKWTKGDTQIFLTDLYPEGPFWDMWKEVYASPTRPTMTAWALRNAYGQHTSNSNANAGLTHKRQVCFKNLAIGIYGPAAPITVASWNTPCSKTALVRAYSDYVIRSLELQSFTHYAQPTPSKRVQVTYLARRASSEWPEKRFCNDTTSFFLCELWAGFGIRSLGRMVRNEKEVLDSLRSLESKVFDNGAKVVVKDVDYNLLSFKDQIKTDLETDIMIGPHGAGLMHNIFMRDRAVLIELSVDGSGGNRHFHNLARWYGRDYVNLVPGNPIDASSLTAAVEKAVKKLNLDRY